MIRKILYDRGGLHNRVTGRLRLEPFNLHECERFLKSKSIDLTRKQIIEIVMTTGGIPFYLKEVAKGRKVGRQLRPSMRSVSDVMACSAMNLTASIIPCLLAPRITWQSFGPSPKVTVA